MYLNHIHKAGKHVNKKAAENVKNNSNKKKRKKKPQMEKKNKWNL